MDIDMEVIAKIESDFRQTGKSKKGAVGLLQVMEHSALRDYLVVKERLNPDKKNRGWKTTKDSKRAREAWKLIGSDTEEGRMFNLQVGTWYMNQRVPNMLEAFELKDTWQNRLTAYNFGIGSLANKVGGRLDKIPDDTKEYLANYHQWKGAKDGGVKDWDKIKRISDYKAYFK